MDLLLVSWALPYVDLQVKKNAPTKSDPLILVFLYFFLSLTEDLPIKKLLQKISSFSFDF